MNNNQNTVSAAEYSIINASPVVSYSYKVINSHAQGYTSSISSLIMLPITIHIFHMNIYEGQDHLIIIIKLIYYQSSGGGWVSNFLLSVHLLSCIYTSTLANIA
jgi:hypothetical protein